MERLLKSLSQSAKAKRANAVLSGWSDEISCKGEGPSFRGQRSNDGKFGEGKLSEIPWSVGQVFDESRVNFNTGHLAGITSASATFAFIKILVILRIVMVGEPHKLRIL
ncbi:uncharacterized protein LOC141671640 [Apium graveolens]|uniref:uncharacterized protein LOC141671640 n=1 Tax=Apium graveolens TaxID=4045 RepID=UPI003D7AEC77